MFACADDQLAARLDLSEKAGGFFRGSGFFGCFLGGSGLFGGGFGRFGRCGFRGCSGSGLIGLGGAACKQAERQHCAKRQRKKFGQ